MNGIRVLIGAALLAMPILAQPSFSGKWELNAAQSKNIGMMAQMKLISIVKPTHDEMAITNVSMLDGKEQTSEFRFDLTGKSVPNKAPMEARRGDCYKMGRKSAGYHLDQSWLRRRHENSADRNAIPLR